MCKIGAQEVHQAVTSVERLGLQTKTSAVEAVYLASEIDLKNSKSS